MLQPRPPVLQTPEEIDICKLLHLLHVCSLRDLLIVEKHPFGRLFVKNLLADESYVVTKSKLATASDPQFDEHLPSVN
jgi:hypothetical protein